MLSVVTRTIARDASCRRLDDVYTMPTHSKQRVPMLALLLRTHLLTHCINRVKLIGLLSVCATFQFDT